MVRVLNIATNFSHQSFPLEHLKKHKHLFRARIFKYIPSFGGLYTHARGLTRVSHVTSWLATKPQESSSLCFPGSWDCRHTPPCQLPELKSPCLKDRRFTR